MAEKTKFKIRTTADFYDDSGKLRYDDIGLSVVEGDDGFEVENFSRHEPEIAPEQLEGAHGVVVLTPSVTARSLSQADRLLGIGRFGVGYETVDVQACTDAGVALFITKGAVDRPVAEACVGWMLALTHRMPAKDRLVREGAWDERSGYMGCELRDRTLGVIGLGGIGSELVRLLENWGMKQPLAFDPYLDDAAAQERGVKKVELDELLQQADFVSIHCPLTDSTRGLIGAKEIGLMQPGSYLLNTARGGIVEEEPLYEALKEGRLAGAALDCFEEEPVTKPNRFAELENVIMAPHCIAWTGELFRDIGRAAFQGLVDLSRGEKPNGLINPEVFESDRFRRKLEAWRKESEQ